MLAQYTVPVAIGAAQPGIVGGWNDKPTLRTWVQGWTHHPVSEDSDSAFVNYVLHPLAGSDTHVLARSHGWTFMESFLFDFFASFSWEYVFENVFERPSLRDLAVTAPVGALLGEFRWQAGVFPSFTGQPFVELTEDGLLIGIGRRW